MLGKLAVEMLSIRASLVFNPLRFITRTVSTMRFKRLKHLDIFFVAHTGYAYWVAGDESARKRDLSKLSYFHMPGKEPLLTWTVGDVIDRAADLFGDTTAAVYTHQNISKTYTEYQKDVEQLAASLVSLKLPVGSRVAIVAPNIYEVAQLLFAASKAGLVVVGINSFCTLSELEYCLNKAECAGVILGEEFSPVSVYEMLLQIAPELEKTAPGNLKSQRLPFLKHVITIGDTRKPGSMTFDDLMNSATAEDHTTMHMVSAKVQFEQDAFIQYSSGTTGQQKAVRLSHFNVVNNAYIVGRALGYHKQRATICLSLPLIYGFGRTLGALGTTMFGSTIVIPGAAFGPRLCLDAITKHRCTTIYGSTTFFYSLFDHFKEGAYDVSSVRKAIMAGSVCTPAILEMIKTRMNAPSIYIMFGSSETSPAFSSTNPDEPMDRWIRTVGTPLDHVEVKVVDTEGRIVPVNTRGEICTRGPHVFKGYLNDDAQTEQVLRDGWYHTGDEGTMSEDSRISFVGRTKEMINYCGLKVPPLEVESVLNTHPYIEEAQVFGVPDEKFGEKVCAWIKLEPEKVLTQNDIKDFCKERELHWFKVPEHVLFVNSFPRTPNGKVQKSKMREETVRLLNS